MKTLFFRRINRFIFCDRSKTREERRRRYAYDKKTKRRKTTADFLFFTAGINFWSKIRRFAYDNFSYSTKKPRILSYFRNFTVKYVVFAVFFVILNKKRVLDFSSITGRNLINTIYFRNYSHKKYLFFDRSAKNFCTFN